MRETLSDHILSAVRTRGEASIRQIVADVGHIITTPEAIESARRFFAHPTTRLRLDTHSRQQLAELGRRRIVTIRLGALTQRQRLRRLRKGVYTLAEKP